MCDIKASVLGEAKVGCANFLVKVLQDFTHWTCKDRLDHNQVLPGPGLGYAPHYGLANHFNRCPIKRA